MADEPSIAHFPPFPHPCLRGNQNNLEPRNRRINRFPMGCSPTSGPFSAHRSFCIRAVDHRRNLCYYELVHERPQLGWKRTSRTAEGAAAAHGREGGRGRSLASTALLIHLKRRCYGTRFNPVNYVWKTHRPWTAASGPADQLIKKRPSGGRQGGEGWGSLLKKTFHCPDNIHKRK